MVQLAKAIADKVEYEGKKPFLDNGDLDEARVETFSKLFQTELCGMTAFVGGVVAQEVRTVFIGVAWSVRDICCGW